MKKKRQDKRNTTTEQSDRGGYKIKTCCKKSFRAGMLVALAVVALHDKETIYREIVDLEGEDKLIEVAEENDDVDQSGLRRYGYVE